MIALLIFGVIHSVSIITHPDVQMHQHSLGNSTDTGTNSSDRERFLRAGIDFVFIIIYTVVLTVSEYFLYKKVFEFLYQKYGNVRVDKHNHRVELFSTLKLNAELVG
jgi:hypothetical protein